MILWAASSHGAIVELVQDQYRKHLGTIEEEQVMLLFFISIFHHCYICFCKYPACKARPENQWATLCRKLHWVAQTPVRWKILWLPVVSNFFYQCLQHQGRARRSGKVCLMGRVYRSFHVHLVFHNIHLPFRALTKTRTQLLLSMISPKERIYWDIVHSLFCRVSFTCICFIFMYFYTICFFFLIFLLFHFIFYYIWYLSDWYLYPCFISVHSSWFISVSFFLIYFGFILFDLFRFLRFILGPLFFGFFLDFASVTNVFDLHNSISNRILALYPFCRVGCMNHT